MPPLGADVDFTPISDCFWVPTIKSIYAHYAGFAVVVVVDVEQATAPMAYVSCPGCEISGRSGFAFHSSLNSKALSGLAIIR